MTRGSAPRLARLLLWLLTPDDRRSEVEADLSELFALRAKLRGEAYARRRYYGDILSLWRRSSMRDGSSACDVQHPDFAREVGQDLIYAARLLRRSPGVVVVTVLGLGLTIGVSTAVFSLLNAVAFRPTGIVDPSSAVHVLRKDQNGMSTSWSHAEYVRLRDAAKSTRVEASLREDTSLSTARDRSNAAQVSLNFVSGGYLAALNGRVASGRTLTGADDSVGAPPVAVVSHRL